VKAPKQDWPKVSYTTTQLGGGLTQQGVSYPGGLDLTTPTLRLQPGSLRDGVNFECAQFGGYARADGYERVDGRPAPSAATFQIIQLVSFTNVPTAGQVVTQTTTGAAGTIIAVVISPTPYIAVTRITGSFDDTHALTTPGPVAIGTATTLMVGISAKNQAIYTAASADVYRALILAVPGSGPVRGVVAQAFLGVDQLFAFRDNTGGTAELLYKATSGGWVLVPFFNLVSFTAGGTTEPFDGETLTQGGVTAVIQRVMWQSGAWTGTAVGQFVVVNPTGGNFTSGSAATTSGAVVTLSGAQVPITMLPGGRFEFDKCNFAGQAITLRVYGCDSVNPPFEFDGVTLAPITTGLSPNAPTHIRFHQNFLWISQASSLFFCAAGLPFKWDAIDGGGEIATGDVVTGMITLPGSQTSATLGVFLATNASFIYGTDPTTFNFVKFNTGIGCIPYSVQNLFDTFFLDDLGVVTLKTTLNWGNFLPTTLTKNILPFIARERGNLLASSVNRSKSQYRLFFNDGYALYCTILNQQYLGSSVMLFPDTVHCIDTTNLLTDNEATYVGCQDGFVRQLDIGTSFDGQVIDAYVVTAWDPVKSPRILKRFRAASLELQSTGFTELQYGYQLAYGNMQTEQVPSVDASLVLGTVPNWDQFVWDNFVWDGPGTMAPMDFDVTGTAENIQVSITCGTNYIPTFTINSIIHHYSMRRGLRV